MDNRNLPLIILIFKYKKKAIIFIMAVEHRRSVSIIAYELTIMPTLVCTSSDSGLSHSLATCLKAPKTGNCPPRSGLGN